MKASDRNPEVINRVLVERLLEFCDPFQTLGISRDWGTWLEKATLHLEYSDNRDKAYHQGRIRYFVTCLRSGQETDPIDVDNVCDGGHIYPVPTILDGHHRLIAHVIASRKRISCSYGGRVDLVRYLEGKRKTCPQ